MYHPRDSKRFFFLFCDERMRQKENMKNYPQIMGCLPKSDDKIFTCKTLFCANK